MASQEDWTVKIYVLLCGITPPKGGGGSVGRILTEIASKIFTTPKDARIPKTYEQKDQEPNRIILTDRQRQIQSHMEPTIEERIQRAFPRHHPTLAEQVLKRR
ncbi:hypothetical protein ARALYDRAFT_888777 [Arabidopsis lyrata subsp. lyrata]|uniref:Uncharacterized protein n=1 Tax=Arabidopsis lyrata subsp. lyrata TaxID=81972 RepID=D7KBG3_ARALL|nr:uncharacterized protein LOC9328847 [Arabidopsis lyrata subsp. lyrata]EFH69044.1 hypothetical protein ARALYDRAFT_888777 [Arabidopsis lyrata subsp. lyrata]|eukprot:XP_002892785.1 uncharacterized protein LOC9328847 [Arabidopsis lyrata subsp. lyrata]